MREVLAPWQGRCKFVFIMCGKVKSAQLVFISKPFFLPGLLTTEQI